MKILIVTTEIGLDGGGMSLSCTRLTRILSQNNVVEVVNSLLLHPFLLRQVEYSRC